MTSKRADLTPEQTDEMYIRAERECEPLSDEEKAVAAQVLAEIGYPLYEMLQQMTKREVMLVHHVRAEIVERYRPCWDSTCNTVRARLPVDYHVRAKRFVSHMWDIVHNKT